MVAAAMAPEFLADDLGKRIFYMAKTQSQDPKPRPEAKTRSQDPKRSPEANVKDIIGLAFAPPAWLGLRRVLAGIRRSW
jgi:hypothetical protein